MWPIRFKKFRSLKSRLAIWVFLPTMFISAVDLVITWRDTDATATLVQEQLLKGSAKIISEQLSIVDGEYDLNIPPAAIELFASQYKDLVFYSVRSKEGVLLAGTEELPVYDKALPIDDPGYRLVNLRGEPMRVIAYAHALPNSATDFAITQVAQTLKGHSAFRRNLFWLTMRDHLILLVIVVIALVIAFRWTLSPVRSFADSLARRQPGSLERLDEASAPRELVPVIHAMNDYVERLDSTLDSYEQFVANTAHHLRTAFAILTTQVNFGMRSKGLDSEQSELLQAMQKSIAQGSKIINQLLVLAVVEKDRHLMLSAPPPPGLNLSELITSVIEALAPLAQQKEVELGVTTLDPGIQVALPPYQLRELVSNLVDNAIQHMGRPGLVTVALKRSDGRALLVVTDNGPGIPREQHEKVFQRFYSIDPSRPGSSGLGLAIVKEICDSLQATITLSEPEGGHGLQVDVSLPEIPV